jgi:isoamylase
MGPPELLRLWDRLEVGEGLPSPLGISRAADGINIAVYVNGGRDVALSLLHPHTGSELHRLPMNHRTGDVCHLWIAGLPNDLEYRFVIDGTHWTDPYQLAPGLLPAAAPFDWEGVQSPRLPLSELVIYEMHVRGFAKTFAATIEKIPYLKSLGVNAVELLPIFSFDPQTNYWGYGTINFFTPAPHLARSEPINEFKRLIQALHRAGIEVILDVVYNHTGEPRPLLPVYYMEGNYSGCGNTLNPDHPAVRHLILDSLRYWVSEFHIDGFRFDLASVFTRASDGTPHSPPPLVQAIAADPILAKTKLIAEPWDAAGLYQVGQFPQWGRWSEWNGPFRDAVRDFLRGAPSSAGRFATALAGSRDLYGNHGTPASSINFVTCHDGFTLADLVAYDHKHNEANGEQNRDGSNDNRSWNCGVEGPTTDPAILDLRNRQMRNFLLALLISQGVPMLRMGDEYGHTAHGNNNTWCQDNSLSWFDWENTDPDLFAYLQRLIAFRRDHPSLRLPNFPGPDRLIWHDPDWSDQSHFVAFELDDLFVSFNAADHERTLTLPQGTWNVIVDTTTWGPNKTAEGSYSLDHHSAILLVRL